MESCYRIPAGVEFLRWNGGEEWVVYHPGTGETLRLSEGAVLILDLLKEAKSPLAADALTHALAGMMDDPPAAEVLAEATGKLVAMLLRHECIERAACG